MSATSEIPRCIPITLYAKIAHKLKSIQSLSHWLIPSKAPKISDHIARDIGMSQHDLEVMRHQWPSESYRHPHL